MHSLYFRWLGKQADQIVIFLRCRGFYWQYRQIVSWRFVLTSLFVSKSAIVRLSICRIVIVLNKLTRARDLSKVKRSVFTFSSGQKFVWQKICLLHAGRQFPISRISVKPRLTSYYILRTMCGHQARKGFVSTHRQTFKLYLWLTWMFPFLFQNSVLLCAN